LNKVILQQNLDIFNCLRYMLVKRLKNSPNNKQCVSIKNMKKLLI